MNMNRIINRISLISIWAILGVIVLKIIIVYKAIDRSPKVHFNTNHEAYDNFLNAHNNEEYYIYVDAFERDQYVTVNPNDTFAIRYEDQKILLIALDEEINIGVSDFDTILVHYMRGNILELVLDESSLDNENQRSEICCFPMPDDFFVRQFSKQELHLREVFDDYLPKGKWVVNEK